MKNLQNILLLLITASVFLADKLSIIKIGNFELFFYRLFVIASIYFIIRYKYKGEIRAKYSFLIILIVLYSALSVIWSPSLNTFISEFGVILFGCFFLLFVIGIVERDIQIKNIILIWLIGAFIINILGIYEVLNSEYFFSVDESLELSNSRLLEDIGFFVPKSVFSNQNNYAYFNSLTFLILTGAFIKFRSINIFYKLLFITTIVSCIYLLLHSYSRSALIASFLGMFVFYLIFFIKKRKILPIFIVLIILILVYFVNIDSIELLLGAIIEKQASTDDSVRSKYYMTLLKYSLNHFGIGMGPGSSIFALNGSSPHNHILQFLVEYGFFLWLFFVYLLFKMFKRLILSNDPLNLMLGVTILMYPIHAVGPSSMTTESFFWLWQAILVIMSNNSTRLNSNIKNIPLIANKNIL